MSVSLTLRLPEPLKAEAAAYADSLGLSINALCTVALRDYLDARQRAPQVVAPALLPAPAPALAPASAAVPRRRPAAPVPEPQRVPKVGRNDPCPCGSGRKFKVCHGRPATA